MKKLAVLILALCLSGFTFANKGNRRFVASLDNSAVVKSKKESRRNLRNFSSGTHYTAVTHGHGFHLFRHRSGASKSESGLGL